MKIEEVVGLIARWWRVQRDPRNSHRESLMAEEAGSVNSRSRHLEIWMETVFHRIYPPEKPKHQPRKQSKKLAAKRQKEKDQTPATWWKSVHGFPLATN
jgi:hypothetical protein